MTIYAVTFYFLFLSALHDVGSSKFKRSYPIQAVLFIVLVYQAGMRWKMGTDWEPYRNHFDASTSFEFVLLNSVAGYELGYGLSTFLVRALTENYSVYLVLHAAVFYHLIFRATERLSPFPLVSVLVFYALTIGVLGSSRQLMALSICLCALPAVFDRRPFGFLLLVVAAALFHTSALIFIVFYFLNRDIRPSVILGVLGCSVLIGYSPLPALVFERIGGLFGDIGAYKAAYYADNSNLGNVGLSVSGLVKRLLVLFLLMLGYRAIVDVFPKFRLLFNGYCFGLLIYFLFSNSLLIVVSRGSLYFNVMEAFLLPAFLILLKTRIERYVAVFFILLYSLLIFYQGMSVYMDLFVPYQGVFINTDYRRQLY